MKISGCFKFSLQGVVSLGSWCRTPRRWGQDEAGCAADLVDRGALYRGAEAGVLAVLLDDDMAEIGEIVNDRLPLDRLLPARCQPGDKLVPQDQGQERAKHGAADRLADLAQDRPGAGLDGMFSFL